MSRRLLVAVFFLFSSALLLVFSFMMKGQSISFAVTAAKHAQWNTDQKASTMRNASFLALVIGLVALTAEAICGWFANTGPGQAAARCWKYYSFKGYRMIWSKSSESGFKSSDNSDEEAEREMASGTSALASSAGHRRTPSGRRSVTSPIERSHIQINSVQAAAAMMPSAVAAASE